MKERILLNFSPPSRGRGSKTVMEQHMTENDMLLWHALERTGNSGFKKDTSIMQIESDDEDSRLDSGIVILNVYRIE